MFKLLVVLTLFLSIVIVHSRSVSKEKKNEDNREQYYNASDFDVIYDQKQNASENYRLDVSGVDVVIVHPASILEAILSPLSVLSLMDEFSKKAPHLRPSFNKNLSKNGKEQSEIDSIRTTTASSSKTKLDDIEMSKKPMENASKNLEEKIQVQELLPGFKDKNEIKNVSPTLVGGINR